MASSRGSSHNKIIVDSVHGDIRLTETERRVIDTAPFQRLRQIKQLGMGHLTYPNATHTRFAHSLGVFHLTCRVLDIAQEDGRKFKDDEIENLRLAALLHDIGHYPYSHLLEKIDAVRLTEEQVISQGEPKKTLNAKEEKYPEHEEFGRIIVTSQPELLSAIGGKKRAKIIADIFTRDYTSENREGLQKSKLIHSSTDMDRLDYLVRDSLATGVPYGRIDLNYLLNNLQISPLGMVGFSEKALPAVEHMLLARFYMHRAVYFHKTTFGFEQACAQLLRRLRDMKALGVPRGPTEIQEYAKENKLARFTDSLVDRIILRAAKHSDPVISCLATAVLYRRPPKLLKEVNVFHKGEEANNGSMFRLNCCHRLVDLAEKKGIPLGQFLLCETPRKRLEARSARMSVEEAGAVGTKEEEETTFIFRHGKEEPEPIVDLTHSLLHTHEDFFQSFRLYLVSNDSDREALFLDIQNEIQGWE